MGDPSTTVLRVGDQHYVVREGYRLDSNGDGVPRPR